MAARRAPSTDGRYIIAKGVVRLPIAVRYQGGDWRDWRDQRGQTEMHLSEWMELPP